MYSDYFISERITMQNGAQNNIVRYVNITLPVTVSAIYGGKCIDIAQSVAGTSGNDNITVDHCNLIGGDRTIVQDFRNIRIVFKQ
ncbi:MAG: hypothetical protein IPG09_15730 [Ignavibacteria bacterium]|nr:hypothetical protein [Ignavibacteria bacterium]